MGNDFRIIIITGFAIYQYNRVNYYRETLNEVISKNIQSIASKCSTIDNKEVYTELYGNVVIAFESYAVLGEGKGISVDELESSLSIILLNIKIAMENLKIENLKATFNNEEIPKLLFNISENFEDKESINKVYKILKENDLIV